MSGGQHVGAVRDQASPDAAERDARELARAQAAAAKKAVKPRALRNTGPTTGDGDPCPLDAEHGRMLSIQGTKRQQCPHQSHDGRPKSHPAGPLPATPHIWPLEDRALAEAVAAYMAKREERPS
jgi:hypothetical protein